MNKRKIAVYAFAAIVGLAFAYQVSAKALSFPDIFQTFNPSSLFPVFNADNPNMNATKCTNEQPIAGLDQAQNLQLKRLGKYQLLCNSGVTKTLMTFTGMPVDAAEITSNVQDMVARLQEFAKYGVAPLVIVEPTTANGQLDMAKLAAGDYDSQITSYFAALKQAGVTAAQMGTWVPLPESNLPLWQPTSRTPDTFAAAVNHYLLAARQAYPNLKASVMLNAASYAASDTDWANPQYVSLAPYLHGIQNGLVQSVGIQGFPWMPPKGESSEPSINPSVYLDSSVAKDAADTLGVKDIWLNTGTFASMYTGDATKAVTMDADARRNLLQGVTVQAADLTKQGYAVSINLFAEDKSKTEEGTNWSYFGSAEDALRGAISQWHGMGVGLWLFDTE